MHERLVWVDTAKGIGIILVVLGHFYMGEAGYKFINSFHMPLFFFLSGFLFNEAKYATGTQLIKARSRTLLLPYLSFSVVTYAYWLVIGRHIYSSGFNPLRAFLNIFLSPGGDGYLAHNPPLWFLPCLFLTTLVFYYMAKIFNSNFHLLLVLMASSLVGFGLSLTFKSNWPWSLDVVFTSVVFFGIGYLISRQFLEREYFTGRNNILIGLVVAAGLLGLVYTIAQPNSTILMASNQYGNYFLFYVAAWLGIGAILILARVWEKSAILSYLGLNSLIIFGLHFPLRLIVMKLTSMVCHIEIDAIRASLWWSSLETILVLLILVPLIYLTNKYLFFFIGKSKAPAQDQLTKYSVTG